MPSCTITCAILAHRIHGPAFAQLTHERLRQIGIPTVRDRARLLNASRKALNRPDTSRSVRRPIHHTVTGLGVRIPERGALPLFSDPDYPSDSSYVPSNGSSANSPVHPGPALLAPQRAAFPPSHPPSTHSAPISPLSITSQRSPLDEAGVAADTETSPLEYAVADKLPFRPNDPGYGPRWGPSPLTAPTNSTAPGPVACSLALPNATVPPPLPPQQHQPYTVTAAAGPRSAPEKGPQNRPPVLLDPRGHVTKRDSTGHVALPVHLRAHTQYTRGSSRAQYGVPPPHLAVHKAGELNHLDLGRRAPSPAASRPASTFQIPTAPESIKSVDPTCHHSLSSDHLPLPPADQPHTAERDARAARTAAEPLIAANLPIPAILDEFSIYPRSSSLNYNHGLEAAEAVPAGGAPTRDGPVPYNHPGRGLTVATRPLPITGSASSSTSNLTGTPYHTWSGRAPDSASTTDLTGKSSAASGGSGGFFSTLFKPFSGSNRRKSVYGVAGRDPSEMSKQSSLPSHGSPALTVAALHSSPKLQGRSARPLLFSVQARLDTDRRYNIVEISNVSNGAAIRERLCATIGMDPHSDLYTVWLEPSRGDPRRSPDPALPSGPLSDDEIWTLSQRANARDAPTVRFVISVARTPSQIPPPAGLPPNIGRQANHYGRVSPHHRSPVEPGEALPGFPPTRAADLPLYPDEVFAAFKVPPHPGQGRAQSPYRSNGGSGPPSTDSHRLSDVGSDTSDTGAVVGFERSSRWEMLAGLTGPGGESVSLSELSMQELQRLAAAPPGPSALARPPSFAVRSSRSSLSNGSPVSQSPPRGHLERLSMSSTGSGQVPSAATTATVTSPTRRPGGLLTIDTQAGRSRDSLRAGDGQRFSGSQSSPRGPLQRAGPLSSDLGGLTPSGISPSTRYATEAPTPPRHSPMSPRAWNTLFPSHHVMATDEPTDTAKHTPQASELWHTPVLDALTSPAGSGTNSPATGGPGKYSDLWHTPMKPKSSAEPAHDKSSELWSRPPIAGAGTPSANGGSSNSSSKAALDAAFDRARRDAAQPDEATSSPLASASQLASATTAAPGTVLTAQRAVLDHARPSLESTSSNCSEYYDASEGPTPEKREQRSSSLRRAPSDIPDRATAMQMPRHPDVLRTPARHQLELRHSRSNSDCSRMLGGKRHMRTPSGSSTRSRAGSRAGIIMTPEQAASALSGLSSNNSSAASLPRLTGSRTTLSRVSSNASQRTDGSQWDNISVQSWNHRPTTQLMINNLDLFFPHHDLDQPIIEPLPEVAEGFDPEVDTMPGPTATVNLSSTPPLGSFGSEPIMAAVPQRPPTKGLGLDFGGNPPVQLSPITESESDLRDPCALLASSASPPRPFERIETTSSAGSVAAGSVDSPGRSTQRDSSIPLPRLADAVVASRKRSVRFVVQQAQKRRTLLERQSLSQRTPSGRSQVESPMVPIRTSTDLGRSQESLHQLRSSLARASVTSVDRAGLAHSPSIRAQESFEPPSSEAPLGSTSIASLVTAAYAASPPADASVAPRSGLLRRQSTRLWGHRVTEVRPQKGGSTGGGDEPPGRRPSHKGITPAAATPTTTAAAATATTPNQGSPQAVHSPPTRRNTLDPLIAVVGDQAAGMQTLKIQWLKGRLIGKGSFGRVYHAINAATGEFMAVKQIELPRTANAVINARQRAMIKALYDETKFLKDFDMENIVQYLGFDVVDNTMNIFLEYVAGGSIATLIKQHGPLAEPVMHSFCRQTLSGLAYIHSHNVLHRDIKGGNILVDDRGVCKISDFGISKRNDYELAYDCNSRMSLQGSVFWMAPEVVQAAGYSAKVDIWSFGCLVLEMWTGQRPWLNFNDIQTMYKLGSNCPPPLPDDVDADCTTLLNLCFNPDPLGRPTATELLNNAFCQVEPNFNYVDYYGAASESSVDNYA
ncbi:mitogen-activated protein kinase kinase kinase [Tieghemiomyces parasiticus]|uniref:Mitogen-activated protein kinase kinase kinase n=1 Tax=Tieghemiomyces parasiticus TaxID=78921 RepID=A0A9W8DZ65_9FUNG|nr:mitogen-activated protein kinase kinase kinase [Tieghemiomyces parasiticus]